MMHKTAFERMFHLIEMCASTHFNPAYIVEFNEMLQQGYPQYIKDDKKKKSMINVDS